MSEANDTNNSGQWDIASESYAKHVAPLLMESFADEFVARLDVNESTEALEVAAGSGALSETLAKRVKSLLATDFSPPVFSLADPSVFKDEMESAGFKNVNVDFVSRDLVFKNTNEFWSMLTSGAPPVKVLLYQVGEDGKGKLRDTLEMVI